MNYRDGIIKETEFLTTAELADKLKMNVQVITRKVQSGEIEAYKIGKDWRIPEHAVFSWLETHSNKNKKVKPQTVTATEVLKVTEKLPTQPSKRKFLLEYILTNFEPNKIYSEHEVDSIITRYHKDSKAVRQEFLTEKMMDEVNGQYRRSPEYRLSDR